MLKSGTKQQNQHTENLGTVRFCGYAAQEMKQVERRTRDKYKNQIFDVMK
jgi:hypothetical protein